MGLETEVSSPDGQSDFPPVGRLWKSTNPQQGHQVIRISVDSRNRDAALARLQNWVADVSPRMRQIAGIMQFRINPWGIIPFLLVQGGWNRYYVPGKSMSPENPPENPAEPETPRPKGDKQWM